MTLRRSGVDYATHVWNPVTGCLHPCRDQWCYAARDVKRYAPGPHVPSPGVSRVHLLDEPVRNEKGHRQPWPFGFEPTVHRYRLGDPLDQPARVFVSDYGDLFGSWVPTADIQAVLDVIARRPDLRFLLLTKNPGRYAEFELPDNAWAGTTVTGDGDQERAFDLMAAVTANRWISYEPVLGGFPLEMVRRFDWVTVGAMTGPGARRPKLIDAWVTALLIDAGRHRVPVFLKTNLGPQWEPRREYPEGLVIG